MHHGSFFRLKACTYEKNNCILKIKSQISTHLEPCRIDIFCGHVFSEACIFHFLQTTPRYFKSQNELQTYRK